jgi:hypothetical protein
MRNVIIIVIVSEAPDRKPPAQGKERLQPLERDGTPQTEPTARASESGSPFWTWFIRNPCP